MSRSRSNALSRAGLGATATAVVLGLTACTAASASPADAPARPGAAGLGDSVQPGLGNGGYDVRHYALGMRFAEDLKSYTATTVLKARATRALSRFNLDLTGTEVRSVRVDGQAAHWSRSGEELRITPPEDLPEGAGFTVRVRVGAKVPTAEEAAKLGTSAYGMVRYGGFVQTAAQPSGAHRIAALADHPAQKAPATLTVTAPSRFGTIANGEQTSSRSAGGWTERRFETRQALATQLLQIGVGPFRVVERKGPHGVRLRHAVPRDQAGKILPQLDATVPRILEFLTGRLGTFPQRTYGVYATPAGGELETQSLALMPADQLTAQGMQENGTDGVLAHEAVHEYFGNSVSPHRWSDLWLSEGHAVLYQYLWSEAEHGTRLEKAMRNAYERANKELRASGPVAAPRREAFEPRDRAPYGWGAYQGGALALYALQQKVGERTFQDIERAWVRENRDGTGSTAGFVRLASRVAGQDLKPFLHSWLYSTKLPKMPGHPDWSA